MALRSADPPHRVRLSERQHTLPQVPRAPDACCAGRLVVRPLRLLPVVPGGARWGGRTDHRLAGHGEAKLTAAFGQSWLTGGKLKVRFKSPARPGDTLTINGRILGIEKSADQTVINCDVFCQNQKGEPVITGEANLRLEEK